jgi:hypothetical protein
MRGQSKWTSPFLGAIFCGHLPILPARITTQPQPQPQESGIEERFEGLASTLANLIWERYLSTPAEYFDELGLMELAAMKQHAAPVRDKPWAK